MLKRGQELCANPIGNMTANHNAESYLKTNQKHLLKRQTGEWRTLVEGSGH